MEEAEQKGNWFSTTQWATVLAAGSNSSPQAAAALESLCRSYWYALYSYVRRRGYHPDDAQDLTQGFFARLLEKEYLSDVSPAKGRFRSFLIAALNHYLADQRKHDCAQKRGGGQIPISLNKDEAETTFLLEPASTETPEKIFERRWALTLLDRAMTRLKEEFTAAGKGRAFELLKEFLGSDSADGAYAVPAAELQMSGGAVAVMVHRLRSRYRELVREEVANTVSDLSEVNAEMQHLFAVLGG